MSVILTGRPSPTMSEPAGVSTGRFRLAHVVSHPIQYFAPLYRELASRPEVELTVYFCSDATLRGFHDPGFGRTIAWDSDLVSGFNWRALPSAEGLALRSVRRRPQLDLFRELLVRRYDGIWIHGYNYPSAWLAAAAARGTRARLLIREEQTLLRPRPLAKRAVKRALLGPLFSHACGLYIGVENRRYFEHYGASPDRLFAVPYAVDNDALRRKASELAPRRAELRRKFGVTAPDAPMFLFVGKLIPEKDPLLLLDAFSRVRRDVPSSLVIAGDGPLSREFDRRVAAQQIPNVVRLGFVNQRELPEVYAAADVVVLPSERETWGLVVNEALNFALPVVVSDKVGCAADLVEDASTGFVVPAGEPSTLAERMRLLAAEPDLRRRLGEAGQARVAGYGIQRAAEGIVRACTTDLRAARV